MINAYPECHVQATEIKQLGVIVANTRNELARTEEQLEEAKRLQAFLQELTPPERRAGLVRQRDERHAANLATWQAECDAIQKAQQVCALAHGSH